MRANYLPMDLARWDQTTADAAAVFVFEDELPPRGPTGLCDWRLAGQISRLLLSGKLEGKVGERLLMPFAGRLPWQCLLLIGAGSVHGFSEDVFRTCLRDAMTALERLKAQRVVVGLPERARLGGRKPMDVFRKEASHFEADVWVVDESAPKSAEIGQIG